MTPGEKRLFIVTLSFIIQIVFSMALGTLLSELVTIIKIIYFILSALLVLEIIKNAKSLSSNLPWIILILILPVAGTMLYLFIGNDLHSSKTLKKVNKEVNESKKYYIQDKEIKKIINDNNLDKLRYLSFDSGFPVTMNNKLKYYPLGEIAYKEMLTELKKAKKYIFLEYFRIERGKMWNSILEILKKKVRRA